MNRFNNITKPLMWLMALVLTAFIAGCGGGSSSSTSVPSVLNSAKSIDTFSIAWSTGGGAASSVPGTIDQAAKTIKATVPHATLLNPMIATFTASPGVSVTIGSVPQVSGSTQNDYSLPVSYKVTAADASYATYTALVYRDPTLASLDISPASAVVPVGATQQFMATATYLDASTEDVTTTASWTSDASGNATVDLHTGLAVGVSVTPSSTPVVITAAIGGIGGKTATAPMTVTNAALLSLAITPASGVVAAGSTFQFTATGTYTDGTHPDVTRTANWTADASGHATVGLNTGAASGVSATPSGTPVVITATKGTVSNTADLTVTAPPGPDLLRTANFAVLSTGSTITNAGVTTVTTGDVGATGETIAGTLTVSTGYNNYPLGTETPYVNAKADLPTVLSNANSITQFPCGAGATYNLSGDLSGVHLAPGVTCFSTAILNTGVVTLNGPGVYIIRTTAALTPAAGSSVAYGTGTGGTATALNTTVFWVVGSANITSSVGTPTIWKGTILTGGAVTLGDSSTLVNGRVLAAGAVTVTNNTITKP